MNEKLGIAGWRGVTLKPADRKLMGKARLGFGFKFSPFPQEPSQWALWTPGAVSVSFCRTGAPAGSGE